MVSLTNPSSPDDEAAFNQWFDEVHVPEVSRLSGVAAVRRFTAVAQMLPPAAAPTYQYAALYELDDVDLATASLESAAPVFRLSDAADLAGALGFVFRERRVIELDRPFGQSRNESEGKAK